jgi:hypothetical protein
MLVVMNLSLRFKYAGSFLMLCCLLMQTAYAQKKPDWVTNRPFSNEYFTGINFASKQNPDYIEQAKGKALKDLSSEIVVNINGESFLKTTEIDNEVKQTFQENIKTTVQRDLEGYELVEVWQDKNEYWVYFRLSKAGYYALRKQKFETALNNSSGIFSKAKEAEAAGNFYEAVQLYMLSTRPLEPYLAETFDAELKNKSDEIMTGSIMAIGSILSNVKVVAVNKAVKLKAGSSFNENLNVKVILTRAGKETPVSNFPIAYSVDKGIVTLSSLQGITTAEGTSNTVLTAVSSPDKKASVRAAVDIAELIREHEDVLISKAIKKKAGSYDLFLIELKSPTICFVSDEKNLSKKMGVNVLEPSLKDLFKEMGFTFVSAQAGADYVVNIEADTRAGGQAYDLFVSFLDANITITDNSKNEQIFSKQFPGVKGVKQDQAAAGNEAYRKLINTGFKNDLFPELKRKFGF